MDGAEWLEILFMPALGRESLAYGNDAELLRVQLLALRDCAVLDAAQYGDAIRRLEEAVRVAQDKAALRVRPPGSARPAATPSGALRRVLAVGQPIAEVDGMPFLLTSVELWSTRVEVFLAGVPTAESDRYIDRKEADVGGQISNWGRVLREGRSGEAALSQPPARGEGLFEVEVGLRDDVGTDYQPTGGNMSMGRTEWRVHRHHQPGVPDKAAQLTVQALDRHGSVVGQLTLPLQQTQPRP
ncbi:MAG: hypothetical protein V7603_3959 [Micromonosporaceae bacterium]